MTTPKILAFAGSLRRDSFNKKLVSIAASGAAAAGAKVTEIDLKDFPLPVYDGDIEADSGLPDEALALKAMFNEHQGLLIASPEYNSSISAALKNVIDWVSRPAEDETPMQGFAGKVAGLVAASPGGLGGIRALPHLRSILQNINVTVVPAMVAVPGAFQAFNDEGGLADEKKHQAVEAVGADVANLLAKMLA